jgi:PhoPQ-activated pathogenicity-related protein
MGRYDYDFFAEWAWAAYMSAIADQRAYAAIQAGTHTDYVQQRADSYRRAPNVSQGWLDAMLDIELGLFQP